MALHHCRTPRTFLCFHSPSWWILLLVCYINGISWLTSATYCFFTCLFVILNEDISFIFLLVFLSLWTRTYCFFLFLLMLWEAKGLGGKAGDDYYPKIKNHIVTHHLHIDRQKNVKKLCFSRILNNFDLDIPFLEHFRWPEVNIFLRKSSPEYLSIICKRPLQNIDLDWKYVCRFSKILPFFLWIKAFSTTSGDRKWKLKISKSSLEIYLTFAKNRMSISFIIQDI